MTEDKKPDKFEKFFPGLTAPEALHKIATIGSSFEWILNIEDILPMQLVDSMIKISDAHPMFNPDFIDSFKKLTTAIEEFESALNNTFQGLDSSKLANLLAMPIHTGMINFDLYESVLAALSNDDYKFSEEVQQLREQHSGTTVPKEIFIKVIDKLVIPLILSYIVTISTSDTNEIKDAIKENGDENIEFFEQKTDEILEQSNIGDKITEERLQDVEKKLQIIIDNQEEILEKYDDINQEVDR